MSAPQRHPHPVAAAEADIRLDRWLKLHFPGLPHSLLQKLLRNGQIRVDGRRAKADMRLAAGQEVRLPNLSDFEERPSVKPPMGVSKGDRDFIEKMIIFESDTILILNKPAGIAVQGGTGTSRHIDGILANMEDRFGDRPRLVHRLDRDTSGVLAVAKTRDMAAKIGRLFMTRTVQKIYWAVLKGVPEPAQGKVDAALVKTSGPDGDRVRQAGPGEQDVAQHAVTHYSVVDRTGDLAWVSLKPVTGRQHQLRAHMSVIGTPILGDQKYEGDKGIPVGVENKLHLHARRLVLPNPKGGIIDVTAPLPSHMRATFDVLEFNISRYEQKEERH